MNQETVATALDCIRRHPKAEDMELYEALLGLGIPTAEAVRLFQFLPMVYCRVLLAPKGVPFPDTYHTMTPEGTVGPELRLDDHPVWRASVEFARQEVEAGVTGDQVLQAAGRSAEFQGADQMCKQGSLLADIRFVPSVLIWSESGPGAAEVGTAPRNPRRWWQFWK